MYAFLFCNFLKLLSQEPGIYFCPLNFSNSLISPHTQYYPIIITRFELFPPALVDGLSLEFEGQQVSSSVQDSSQYSGRLQ